MVRMHPLTIMLLSAIIFFMTLTYSHPLYIVSILTFLVLCIVISGHINKLKSAIKAGLYTAVLIVVVNPLVSDAGRTVIYRSPGIPVLGKVKITVEALAFGANMSLKLLCILFVFFFYSVLTDSDDAFSFTSRYAHKLTLVLSMTTNIIHRLHLEIMRVKDVMVLRGVNFNEKNLIKRAKAYYPVLKVILISSLEGSLDRAEALYSRAYGKQKRTSYSQNRMNEIDYVFAILSALLICVFIFGFVWNIGFYSFYPVLDKFAFRDILFLVLLNFILLIIFLLIWRCTKWGLLKFGI